MVTKQAELVQTMCEYVVVPVADNVTVVTTTPTVLFGVYVNTVLSAHVLPIADGTTNVISVPASSAVGFNRTFLDGIRLENGLTVNPDDAATGSVTVAYRTVNPSFVDGLTAITPA